jgi:hypothetical protein
MNKINVHENGTICEPLAMFWILGNTWNEGTSGRYEFMFCSAAPRPSLSLAFPFHIRHTTALSSTNTLPLTSPIRQSIVHRIYIDKGSLRNGNYITIIPWNLAVKKIMAASQGFNRDDDRRMILSRRCSRRDNTAIQLTCIVKLTILINVIAFSK